MITLDLLCYIRDHVQPFGYMKWPCYFTEMPKMPTAQEALAQAAASLEKQKAYVAALENVEEAIADPEKLRPETVSLLRDYLDHPDKCGMPNYGGLSLAGLSYAHPPSATQLEADARTRVEAIREWEAAEVAIRALPESRP